MSAAKLCPCHSDVLYVACCRPFHRREREAETAGILMRSRYAAFATGEVAYLAHTIDGSHEDKLLPPRELLASLRQACRESRYMGLRVKEELPPDEKGIARVRFVARVFQNGRDCSFEELSSFRRDNDGWRYLAAEEQRLVRGAG